MPSDIPRGAPPMRPCRPAAGGAAPAWPARNPLRAPADLLRGFPLPFRKARAALRARSAARQRAAFSCAGCDGRCCTARYNRMRIAPVEARLIARYLETVLASADLARLRAALRRRIRRHRLRRADVPQAYTCPFFRRADHACGLPAAVKPIGCLAFNPSPAGRCDTDLLLFAPAHHAARAAGGGPALPIPIAVDDALRVAPLIAPPSPSAPRRSGRTDPPD